MEEEIAKILGTGELGGIGIEYCYIPIVMGPEFADLYPPRSHFNKQEGKIFHSPVLNFEIFVNGTDREMKLEYIRGMQVDDRLLKKSGLSSDQATEFNNSVEKMKQMVSGI